MDQLISQITQRTGISDQQAREAVNITLSFVKQQLPAPVAAQVDSMLAGQGNQDMTKEAEQAAGRLGGMFGQR